MNLLSNLRRDDAKTLYWESATQVHASICVLFHIIIRSAGQLSATAMFTSCQFNDQDEQDGRRANRGNTACSPCSDCRRVPKSCKLGMQWTNISIANGRYIHVNSHYVRNRIRYYHGNVSDIYYQHHVHPLYEHDTCHYDIEVTKLNQKQLHDQILNLFCEILHLYFIFCQNFHLYCIILSNFEFVLYTCHRQGHDERTTVEGLSD